MLAQKNAKQPKQQKERDKVGIKVVTASSVGMLE